MRGWSTSWPRNSGRLDGRLPLETTFNIRGERGSIDVFGFHLPTGTVVVIEVKSVVPDVQATLLVLDRKTRLAREIARQLGWTARAVARVLVVGDGRTTRRRVASHRAIFAAAFPHRTIAVKRWLRSPDTSGPFSGLWFLADARRVSARQRASEPVGRVTHGRARSGVSNSASAADTRHLRRTP